MIELNIVERKYLNLSKGLININQFEQWVYGNEQDIIKLYSKQIYEDLIILNYSDSHAKSNLVKIINIDFERLKRFQVQNLLLELIKFESEELEEVIFDEYGFIYDVHHRHAFSFNINFITISLTLPFELEPFKEKFNVEKVKEEIRTRFKKPHKFFQMLLDELFNGRLEVVVLENFADIDSRDYIKVISPKSDEVSISINSHGMRIDKEYLNFKMNRYWS